MRFSAVFGVVITVVIVLAGCTQLAAPPSNTPTSAPKAEGTARPVVNEWDALIAAAKKEGRLSIYDGLRPEARSAVTKTMAEKFGIEVDWVSGRGAELVPKIKAERQAGLYLGDITFVGPPNFTDLAAVHALTPIDPALILPDVKDPTKWIGGRLPYLDPEHLAIKPVLTAQPFYVMNTDKVKPGEINYAPDLLNPKWKGQIAISDPGIFGGGNDWFAFTLLEVLGMDKGVPFMKGLAGQDPVVTRDERLLTEWVAKGKYAIGIAPTKAVVAEFIKMQAPIAFIDTKEARSVSPGAALMMMLKDAPHPNSAKLFVNWVLSKEGNSIFAPASQFPSTRVDVSQESFLPILVPRPDDVDPQQKYPDYDVRKGELRTLAGEIFK